MILVQQSINNIVSYIFLLEVHKYKIMIQITALSYKHENNRKNYLRHQ